MHGNLAQGAERFEQKNLTIPPTESATLDDVGSVHLRFGKRPKREKSKEKEEDLHGS